MVADFSHWINVCETDPNDPDLTAVIENLAGEFQLFNFYTVDVQ